MKINTIEHWGLRQLLGAKTDEQVEAFLKSDQADAIIAFLQTGLFDEIKRFQSGDYAGFWNGLPPEARQAILTEIRRTGLMGQTATGVLPSPAGVPSA